MQLMINIDDKDLEAAVKTGLENLDKDVIAGIAKDAIAKFLSEPATVGCLLFERSSWGAAPNYENPRWWFKDIVAGVFTPEDFEKEKAKMLEVLEKERPGIIVDVLANVFSQGLMTYDMQAELRHAISRRNGGD